MCEPSTATENVWHVLDVLEGSPAESAGLVPMGDWILGPLFPFPEKLERSWADYTIRLVWGSP